MAKLVTFVFRATGRDVFLLKGYAGTGKSSLVGALVKTLSQDGIQSMHLTKELIKHPNPPKVYFALEDIASTVEDFENTLCINCIINDAVNQRKKQKNKLLQYLKLTKNWNI